VLKSQIGLQLWIAEVDVNKAWETIRGNIKVSAKESLGYYELKKHKPWFNKGPVARMWERSNAYRILFIIGGVGLSL
jgi:hypothetical protein